MLSFFFILLAVMQVNPSVAESTKKLSELDAFLKDLRANLRSDRILQNQYTFNLKRTKIQLDKEGNPKKIEVDKYEVFPSLDNEYTYVRQIVKDGKPVDPEKIEERDRSHAQKMKKLAKELTEEGIDEKTRRLRKEDEEKRKEDRVIDELFRMYEFSLVQRDIFDGYPAIILDFRPRPDFKPSTREGKVLSKLAGRAWICEEDHQLMRADVEFIDNVSFGMGLLARLHKGTKASILRRRINNEVWLPAEAHIEGSARILLLKKLEFNTTNEYSNYKKFVVDTTVEYGRSEHKTESTP